MADFPVGDAPGALSYMFLQKLCERLEGNNVLPTGEAKRIWGEILAELQNENRVLGVECRQAIVNHKLA